MSTCLQMTHASFNKNCDGPIFLNSLHFYFKDTCKTKQTSFSSSSSFTSLFLLMDALSNAFDETESGEDKKINEQVQKWI